MIPYVAGAAVGFARNEGREVSEAFSNGMTAAVDGIGAAYGFVAGKATDFVHGVGVAAGTARHFVDDRARAVGSVIGGVRDAVGERVDAAKSVVRTGIDTVRAVPGMAVAGLAGLGRSAISGIQGWWKETTAEFSRGYEAGYGGRESAVEGVRQAAADEFDRGYERVTSEVARESVPTGPRDVDELIGWAHSVLDDGSWHDPLNEPLRPSVVPGLSTEPDKALSGGLDDMQEAHENGPVYVGKEPTLAGDEPALDEESFAMA